MEKMFFKVIDGHELYFNCKSKRAEDRVIQIAELYIDGEKIASGRSHYFNRSWEAFPYKNAIFSILDRLYFSDNYKYIVRSYRAQLARPAR